MCIYMKNFRIVLPILVGWLTGQTRGGAETNIGNSSNLAQVVVQSLKVGQGFLPCGLAILEGQKFAN